MTRPIALLDLDATLLDCDPLHHAAFASRLARRGCACEVHRTHIMGQPDSAIMSRVFPGREADRSARAEAMFRDTRARVSPAAGGLCAAGAAGAHVFGVTAATSRRRCARPARVGP